MEYHADDLYIYIHIYICICIYIYILCMYKRNVMYQWIEQQNFEAWSLAPETRDWNGSEPPRTCTFAPRLVHGIPGLKLSGQTI